MGIADDLPTLADRLANPAPGDPEQACLRRAIPTAYYALFHLLVQEAVQGWSGSPATLPWAGENPRTQKHAGCVRNHLPGFLERVEHPADFRACLTKGCREDVLRLARVAPRGGLRQCQDLDRRWRARQSRTRPRCFSELAENPDRSRDERVSAVASGRQEAGMSRQNHRSPTR